MKGMEHFAASAHELNVVRRRCNCRARLVGNFRNHGLVTKNIFTVDTSDMYIMSSLVRE